jgi:hypothetical protein
MWLFSVAPEQHQDGRTNYVNTVSFHTIPNYVFTNHPIIRRYEYSLLTATTIKVARNDPAVNKIED